MIQMAPFKCMECGEDAPHTHPEYHRDHLCSGCLIAYLEDTYESALENLRDAVDKTGVVSVTLSFIEADKKRNE